MFRPAEKPARRMGSVPVMNAARAFPSQPRHPGMTLVDMEDRSAPECVVMGKILRLLIVAAFLVWAVGARAAGPVVVASKIDTEGALLGNMIAAALEAQGLQVTRKIQLGPTNIVRAAILAGQIDIYPEYTGNGGIFFHQESDPAWKNAAEGYAKVKSLDAAQNHLPYG